MSIKAKETEKIVEKIEVEDLNTCGIVMPISAIDGCSEKHWSEVLSIIKASVKDAGFKGNLVSDANDVGIIHKRIIQNLYDNPIVICDVSCKNPNVMFELGIRLAFDKPTIIIKDDKTTYSFDTSAIEHIDYPRDLHYHQINDFKIKLSEKIKATYGKAISDDKYSPFLKHFGEFKVAKIEKKEVTEEKFILEELKSIRMSIENIRTRPSKKINVISDLFYEDYDFHVSIIAKDYSLDDLYGKLDSATFIENYQILEHGDIYDIRGVFVKDYPHGLADVRLKRLLKYSK